MDITNEDWIEYRNNVTKYLEQYSQYAIRKAVQIAIDKQIPMKAIKVDVQPYFRKHFADRYECPVCHREVHSYWNGCPYCLQALEIDRC